MCRLSIIRGTLKKGEGERVERDGGRKERGSGGERERERGKLYKN